MAARKGVWNDHAQAQIAVWAILADWIKAQTAMMAAGFLDTDTAFLSHIAAPDGRRVIDVVKAGGGNLLLGKGGAE